jgi:hypothetical protein
MSTRVRPVSGMVSPSPVRFLVASCDRSPAGSFAHRSGVRSAVELAVLSRTDPSDGQSLPVLALLGFVAHFLAKGDLAKGVKTGQTPVHLRPYVCFDLEQVDGGLEPGPVTEGAEVAADEAIGRDFLASLCASPAM